MAKSVKSFIVGSGTYPEWFKEQASKGRARINYDEEDGSLIDIMIYGATKNYTAKPGDTILYTRSGLSVIDKAAINQQKEGK